MLYFYRASFLRGARRFAAARRRHDISGRFLHDGKARGLLDLDDEDDGAMPPAHDAMKCGLSLAAARRFTNAGRCRNGRADDLMGGFFSMIPTSDDQRATAAPAGCRSR